MEALRGWEIIEAVNGHHKGGKKESLFVGVSTDTRLLRSGELFIALSGKKYDGHDFISQALKKGASGLLVSKEVSSLNVPSDVLVVEVRDTMEALGRLARYYREKFPVKVIAITGSTGKTTTKEMIYHLLSPYFRTISSPGNYNNFIGVPLSLFQLKSHHEVAVIEMGTNAPGEIRWLSWVAQPDIGVITDVSEAHLEGLGDIIGVAKAKAELLENVKVGGYFVFNADNAWCRWMANNFNGRLLGFGLGEEAQIKGTGLKTHTGEYYMERGRISFNVNGGYKVWLNVPGVHNVYNALAALAVAQCLGLKLEEVSQRLKDFRLPPMRMERHCVGGITIINDAYNASPASWSAALSEFSSIAVSGRKCIICGSMAELGKEAFRLHWELGGRIANAGVDLLIVTGEFAKEVAKAARGVGMTDSQVHVCSSPEEVYSTATSLLKEGDVVLIKASRYMRLEEICGRLKEYFADLSNEKVDMGCALHKGRVRV